MENRKRFGVEGSRRSQGESRKTDDFKKKFYPPKFENDRPKADIVFGFQSVLETLRSDKEIDKIMIQREFAHPEIDELAKGRGVPVQKVPSEKLDRITRKNHQGVIAFVAAVNYAKLSNVIATIFEKGENPLLLLLDRITDVRNFGAIARTAECAGVQAIVTPMRETAQVNSDAMKTSSGALNFLPVCRESSLLSAIEELQQSGIQVIACTEKAAEGSLYEIDFQLPTALIMGSEEDGISEEIIRKVDFLAKIPMHGQVGSLNVSVATGVVLYEVVRQRRA